MSIGIGAVNGLLGIMLIAMMFGGSPSFMIVLAKIGSGVFAASLFFGAAKLFKKN